MSTIYYHPLGVPKLVRDFFPWLDGFWHFNKVSIYLSIYLSIYQKRLTIFVTKWSRLNVKTSMAEMPTSGDSHFFTTLPEFQRYFCGKINSQSRFFKAWESRQNSTTPALVALRKTRENQWWSREMLAVFSGWVFWTFHSLNSAKRG